VDRLSLQALKMGQRFRHSLVHFLQTLLSELDAARKQDILAPSIIPVSRYT
jgi:hypothetical protein